MPRLNAFDIRVQTGERGLASAPRFIINGFPLEFDEAEGSVEPGGIYEATGRPGSFPHTLLLTGPEHGAWDIAGVRVTYYPEGQEPYTLRLGSITLGDDADLNIWYERPIPTFDV